MARRRRRRARAARPRRARTRGAMAPEPDAEGIEVRLLLEAIHARYGFDLRDYALSSMRRRARAALARSGLRHLGELQHRILRDPSSFPAVLDDLTVRVT